MPVDLHDFTNTVLIALLIAVLVVLALRATAKGPLSRSIGRLRGIALVLYFGLASSTCSLDGALGRIQYGVRFDSELSREIFSLFATVIFAIPGIFLIARALEMRPSWPWRLVRGSIALVCLAAPVALLALRLGERAAPPTPTATETPGLATFLPERQDYAGPCGRLFVSGATRLWLHCGQSLERDEAPTWIEVTALTKPGGPPDAGPFLVRTCVATELGRSTTPCILSMSLTRPEESFSLGQEASSEWHKIASNVDLSTEYDARVDLWTITKTEGRSSIVEGASTAPEVWNFDGKTFALFGGIVRASDFQPPPIRLFAFLLPAAFLALAALAWQRRAQQKLVAIARGLTGQLVAGQVKLDAHPDVVIPAPAVALANGPIVWVGAAITEATSGYRDNPRAAPNDLLSGTREALVAAQEHRQSDAQVVLVTCAAIVSLPFMLVGAMLGSPHKTQATAASVAAPELTAHAPVCPAGMTLHAASDVTALQRTVHTPAFCVDDQAIPDDAASNVDRERAETICASEKKGLLNEEEAHLLGEVKGAVDDLVLMTETPATRFVIAPGCEIACAEGPRCSNNPTCLPHDALIPSPGIPGKVAVRCATLLDK